MNKDKNMDLNCGFSNNKQYIGDKNKSRRGGKNKSAILWKAEKIEIFFKKASFSGAC